MIVENNNSKYLNATKISKKFIGNYDISIRNSFNWILEKEYIIATYIDF